MSEIKSELKAGGEEVYLVCPRCKQDRFTLSGLRRHRCPLDASGQTFSMRGGRSEQITLPEYIGAVNVALERLRARARELEVLRSRLLA
jgi:hypothetical protein